MYHLTTVPGDFETLEQAVEKAVEESKDGKTVQITTLLKKGVYGYAGSTCVVATFFDGQDVMSHAADEDGVPDMDARRTALVRRPARRP